ncbi:hypothetical protein LTR64_003770 [Lithohypha guttulata]|uniref:uncharacterized protein n=1 Tax=Lithohypha guttulata TaxID=1690604 RepID=UPI00315CA844
MPVEIYEKVHHDPASLHCTTLARGWFSNCADNHNCTATARFASNSVTRFLHIDSVGRKVRLIEYASNEAPSSWAALSYRWGHCQKRMVLTQSNITELKQGISLHDLDATVRDAAFIAQALDLEYLWVDALCVFQDEAMGDWSIQSSKMQEIYEKSALTLVAVDSPSVQDGFLVPRNEQYVAVKWNLDNSPKGDSGPNTVYLSKHWDPTRDKLKGPWSERGWTFQEGLLPNRLLYFTGTQMVWKCCRETRYERGLTVDPTQKIVDEFAEEGGRNFWAFDLFTKVKLMPWYIRTLDQDIRREKHRLWYELVEEYSARHLTNFSDRSVAISGLAAKYHDLLGADRYLAGLWQADMVRGLLWYVPDSKVFSAPESETRLVENCRYPTWSWLHVAPGHAVRNDHASYMDCRDLAQVRPIHFDDEHSLQWFRNIETAVLSLRGPTLFFDQLYSANWRSSTSLSAFERHISQLIEDQYESRAVELAHQAKFAAVLMLKHFPSIDHRMDVLVLEATGQEGDALSVFQRCGVVQLCYFNVNAKTLQLRRGQESLSHRLGLSSGPRRVKHLCAKAVFDELYTKMWPQQEITMI